MMNSNEDGGKSIRIKSTSDNYGSFINVGELLEGLNHESFNDEYKDEAPIFIHQLLNEENYEPLTTVLICGNCNKIHLESGYEDTSNYVLNSKSIVYQDYRKSENPKYISRAELIDILERIDDKKAPIGICSTFDEGSNPLTDVIKCSPECEAVHLLTGYRKKNINEN